MPGKDGKDGAQGLPGKDGENGAQGLPGKDGASGEREWWIYDSETNILHINSSWVTVESLDVHQKAYVHERLVATEIDGSKPAHEPKEPF